MHILSRNCYPWPLGLVGISAHCKAFKWIEDVELANGMVIFNAATSYPPPLISALQRQRKTKTESI